MLTAEQLKAALHYDPDTGIFTRRFHASPNARAGDVAGTAHIRGYWQIHICGKLMLAHVLAWLYMTGEMPTRRICFRNGLKRDFRWGNLRLTGAEPELTAERLREILHYDPETGIFTYRRSRGPHETGDIVGHISRKSTHQGGGYRVIAVEGREYGAHRLAWLYVHGEFPKGQIDHRNLIRDDNRITNLRPATRSQNVANRGIQSNNTSGMKGVSWHKAAKRWVACIQQEGVYRYLGLFDTKEQAHTAYRAAAINSFKEFARTA